MHQFLKTIGFSNTTELEDQDRLLHDVLTHYDARTVVETPSGHRFVEFSREYASGIGITACGEYDKDNLFRMEYYYPFCRGTQTTSYDNIGIEQHMRTTSFAVACDDIRVGTTLIFHLTNAAEYIDALTKKVPPQRTSAITLSALADTGSILLPVLKEQKMARIDSKNLEKRNSLLEAAQKGDEDAIENLTKQDIDAYAMISRRIQHEDVYSIVDSYLIPYGLECDLYNIMGDITSCRMLRNNITDETLYQLGLNCNDIPLDVLVNRDDLMGEPEVGRRFKGSVWMQGSVAFNL